MAHDVFISYSSKDRKAADELCHALEAGNVRVWIAPRNLAPSSSWAMAIPTAIEASRLVILVFSKHSDTSEWVSREIQHAVSCKTRIMTVRLTDAEPSAGMKFFLNTLHWSDAFPGALSQHAPRITRQTQELLGIRAKSAPPAVREPSPPVKSDPPPASTPVWRMPKPAYLAGGVAAALVLAIGLGVTLLTGGEPIAVVSLTTTGAKEAAVAANECSSTYQDRLAEPSMKDFELPGDDGTAGAYTVVDAATLKVQGKIIKLSQIGRGKEGGAERLRTWLEMAGPTVSCRAADERRCRYTCENEFHQDLSQQILSSDWAAPSDTSVSARN